MAQPPRRIIRIALDPERDPVAAAFLQWAEVAYPGSPFIDALRELIAIGIGADPLDAERLARRRAAWRRQMARARELLGMALKQAGIAYEQGAALDE